MKDEKLAKLQIAMENEEYAKKVVNCENADDLFRILEAESIGYTKEEAENIFKVVQEGLNSELSEDALDDVSGGFIGTIALGAAYLAGCYIVGYVGGKAIRNRCLG